MNTIIRVPFYLVCSISIILPINSAERLPTPFPFYENEQSRVLTEKTERLIKQSAEMAEWQEETYTIDFIVRPIPHRLPKYKPLSIDILSELQIISSDESKVIQTYFQTLTDLLQATPEQLLEIEGITEGIIAKIQRGLLGCNSERDICPVALGLSLFPGQITVLIYHSILRTLWKMFLIGVKISPEEFIKSYEITPAPKTTPPKSSSQQHLSAFLPFTGQTKSVAH